jgi:hypothetical protein
MDYTALVKEELCPTQADIVAKLLLSHKNKKMCICAEKRVITPTLPITALEPSNHTLNALPMS